MRNEFLQHLHPLLVKCLQAGIAFALLLILLGLGASVFDYGGQSFIILCYALGIAFSGAFLVTLGFSVFLLNIRRDANNESTFGLNRYGSSEGGNYVFNQSINLLYIAIGVGLSFLALFMLKI